jgi:hypothetical protein
VDVTVFEPSTDPKILNMGSRVIVFQPNGAMLLVGEEYALQNQSQPPKAYFSAKGDFEFQIPEGAQVSQVSTWGPSRMPVVQGTMDRGKGHYAIAYAFQPGENGVRLSYQVPYPSNHADVRLTSPYAVSRVMLVAAPTVQLSSPGFTSAGNEQGFNLYTRDSMPAGLPFDVSISGTAPAPSATSEGDQQGNDQDPEVNSRASAATVQALPNRLDSLRWIFIGGFAALFALGVLILWRTPGVLAPQGAGAGDLPVPSATSAGPRKRKAVPSAPTQPAAAVPVSSPTSSSYTPVAVAPAPAANLPGIERDVQDSLDGLKDRLFRLELRRQAGTISEEEYARERARTEQILRELVRG